MSDPTPTITTGEMYDAIVGPTIDLNELHRNLPEEAQGKHHWVIPLVFSIDDPEVALDHMMLDATNLLGAGAIHCLFCSDKYLDGFSDVCMGRHD